MAAFLRRSSSHVALGAETTAQLHRSDGQTRFLGGILTLENEMTLCHVRKAGKALKFRHRDSTQREVKRAGVADDQVSYISTACSSNSDVANLTDLDDCRNRSDRNFQHPHIPDTENG